MARFASSPEIVHDVHAAEIEELQLDCLVYAPQLSRDGIGKQVSTLEGIVLRLGVPDGGLALKAIFGGSIPLSSGSKNWRRSKGVLDFIGVQEKLYFQRIPRGFECRYTKQAIRHTQAA